MTQKTHTKHHTPILIAAPIVLLFGCKPEPTEVPPVPVEPPATTSEVTEGVAEPPAFMASNLTEEGLNMATNHQCTGDPSGQPLREPPKVEPIRDGNGSRLNTAMVVSKRERCVPVWNGKEWKRELRELRTYGFLPSQTATADPDNLDVLHWDAPGPTFYLDKSDEGTTNGTRFSMTLYNRIKTKTPPKTTPNNECNTYDYAGNTRGKWPNCFHGDDATNFHFHGFHISPQKHPTREGVGQDYVSVAILPPGDDGKCDEHATAHGASACGKFRYELSPIPYDQAEGTHWYHAHKHGSTALQLLNGLSGTFIIRGEFDKKLETYYKDRNIPYSEKVMVVQQINQNLPFSGAENRARPDHPLVNGQANPVVTIKKGEVQRWRLIGATMQDAAKIRISLNEENLEVRQIARDGVAFDETNYARQPFTQYPGGGVTIPRADFELDPGYRIDLLVRVKDDAEAGQDWVTFDTVGALTEEAQKFVDEREDQINDELIRRAGITEKSASRAEKQAAKQAVKDAKAVLQSGSPLFTVKIDTTGPDAPEFPSPWWPLQKPTFENIDVSGAVEDTVTYSMEGQGTPGSIMFYIDNTQYDHTCVNNTLVVGEPQKWTLRNTSGIAHPFHIHVNPFQLASVTVAPGKYGTVNYGDSPPWMDTISIPVAYNVYRKCTDRNDNSSCEKDPYPPYIACMERELAPAKQAGDRWCGYDAPCVRTALSTCLTEANKACGKETGEGKCVRLRAVSTPGEAVIHQLARTYSGGFVQHCHILGHEDRGMMLNVQTVCPSDNNWAVPQADGTTECGVGKPLPAVPACVLNKPKPPCPTCPPDENGAAD